MNKNQKIATSTFYWLKELFDGSLPFLGFALLSMAMLSPPQACAAADDRIDRFDIQLQAGYRVDELNWNHAGPSGSPNILSELTWEDLEIYQVGAKGKLNLQNDKLFFGAAVRSSISYGKIIDGENQDSDYGGDNRTLEGSRSNNDAGDGSVYDFSIGVGPTFFTHSSKIRLTPLLGYSYHEQNLTMSDGYQTISDSTIFPSISTPVGPFAGLDSTYDARWKGVWVGVELEFFATESLAFHSTLELHDAEYSSKADWNLRSDFAHPVSFTNDSDDAGGVVINAGSLYRISSEILLTFDLDYKKWKAEDGFHTIYNDSGTRTVLNLNEVNWESYSVMLGVTFRY